MPTETESAGLEVRNTAAPAAPSLTPNQPQQSPQETVQQLLERLQVDARLKEEFTAFHKTTYRKAVSYALKLIDNRKEAEDLVSRTYIELLQGRTTTRHFFNALRCNCLNRIESADREGEVILRVGELRPDLPSGDEEKTEMDDESFLESISSRHDNRDPVAILLAAEQLEVAKKIVRTNPRYRWVRQKKWWRELMRRSEMASRAEK